MSNYNNLAEAIMDYLEEEIEDIEENVKEITDELTKKAVKELQQNSPKRTGDYAKSWRRQVINTWSKKKYSKYLTNRRYVVRIHNKNYYMLTHLLEFDHATRNGNKRTKPQPHIRPVEEKYNKMYETRLTTAIRTRAYDNKGKQRKKVMYDD